MKRPDRRGADVSLEFDHYFEASSLGCFAHERRGGGTTGVRAVHVAAPAHCGTDPATGDLLLGLVLRGSGRVQWSWDGAHPNETPARRSRTLGLTPPGAAATFEVAGPSEMLIVALPLTELRTRFAEERPIPADFGALHDIYAEHRQVRRLALRLWRAAAPDGAVSDLLIDALAEQLLSALVDVTGARPGQLPSGRLSPREIARVRAKALDPSADVAALALAAGMPLRTFRRYCTATLGTPPHRWLMQSRLRHAADALRLGKQTTAEIAADLGFASQAHLTTMFRQAFGVTPGRYRRKA